MVTQVITLELNPTLLIMHSKYRHSTNEIISNFQYIIGSSYPWNSAGISTNSITVNSSKHEVSRLKLLICRCKKWHKKLHPSLFFVRRFFIKYLNYLIISILFIIFSHLLVQHCSQILNKVSKDNKKKLFNIFFFSIINTVFLLFFLV